MYAQYLAADERNDMLSEKSTERKSRTARRTLVQWHLNRTGMIRFVRLRRSSTAYTSKARQLSPFRPDRSPTATKLVVDVILVRW